MPDARRVGLIGLGTITKNYERGLRESQYLELVSVCDISPEAISVSCYGEYRFYTDYQEMISREGLDCVIISTPPATHFDIASWAMMHGADVIIEKPATATLEDYERLLSISKESGRSLEVMYHWQTGSEVVAFGERYDPSKLSEICVRISDDYTWQSVEIREEKVALGGVWLDSGVNALSMIKLWLPFEDVSIKDIQSIKCRRTGLPLYIDVLLCIDRVNVRIVIDWRYAKDRKESMLGYDGREICVDHSGQRIVDRDQVIAVDDMARLPRHYFNYLVGIGDRSDEAASLKINKILFEVNEKI